MFRIVVYSKRHNFPIFLHFGSQIGMQLLQDIRSKNIPITQFEQSATRTTKYFVFITHPEMLKIISSFHFLVFNQVNEFFSREFGQHCFPPLFFRNKKTKVAEIRGVVDKKQGG